MTLADHLQDVRERLLRNEYPNEAAISGGIVRRVLDALGWPIYDPHVVFPEFSVRGRRVDFALCHPATRPRVFVEVKQPGQARGADQQLFEYAFHEGVPMAVMTDGREWHVYVPAGAGSYDERRVYLVDLTERAPDEAAERLRRYLDYDRVRTEDAIRAARDDYDRLAKSREGERHLPEAWRRLLDEAEAPLVALLGEKVEALCGIRPDDARVTAFLRKQGTGAPAARPAPRPLPPTPAPPAVAEVPPAPKPPAPSVEKAARGFRFEGTWHEARNAADVYRRVIAALIERDPHFAERFSKEGGRKRAYLARDRETLFPGQPDLQDYVTELSGGWLLGLNVSRDTIEKRIRRACEIAGLRYGVDVVVRF